MRRQNEGSEGYTKGKRGMKERKDMRKGWKGIKKKAKYRRKGGKSE